MKKKKSHMSFFIIRFSGFSRFNRFGNPGVHHTRIHYALSESGKIFGMQKLIPAVLCFMLTASCSELIEYSPYDTNIHTQSNTDISKLFSSSESLLTSDTLQFALISDIHDHIDDLDDAVSCLNKQKGLKFIACCGDMTNSGLAQEYQWYIDIIEKSYLPVVSVIGNHDYRSNGLMIYQKLFGSTNQSFILGKYKFILFDDIVLENNNLSPRYEWLISELADSTTSHVLLTHIAPYAGEMEGYHHMIFTDIVRPDNTILCLHGHFHSYSELEYNGIHTIVSGDITDREYVLISLTGKEALAERIRF
jgi:Icc protein